MIEVALGGALGAVLRYLISTVLNSRPSPIPYGTLVVNLVGSFVLGWLITTEHGAWYLLFGVGLCGGMTTFSTLTFETYKLIETGSRLAAVNLALHVVLGLAAVSIGVVLGG